MSTTAQNTPTGTGNGNTATGTGNSAPTQTPGSVSLSDLPDLDTAPSVGAVSSSAAASTTDTATSIFHLSDVPTIAGYGIPTQVVPWTAGAPYMKTSSLPEGTVFIIVGAVLGFLGAAVLAWRGMVAWSLHRSVKRAQLGTQYNDSMLKLGKPTMASSTTALGSNLSLDRLSAPAGKLSRSRDSRAVSSHGLPNTAAARNSSLFFSPTAGAGSHHTATGNANRSSAYLPAGYYASPSAAAPASHNKHASIGGGGLAPSGQPASRLSSLNPNHPSNRGYNQARSDFDVSPPDSPTSTIPPGRPSTAGTTGRGYQRVSSMHGQAAGEWGNLNVPGGAPPGQRAPSANLEDLFEHHGNGMRGH